MTNDNDTSNHNNTTINNDNDDDISVASSNGAESASSSVFIPPQNTGASNTTSSPTVLVEEAAGVSLSALATNKSEESVASKKSTVTFQNEDTLHCVVPLLPSTSTSTPPSTPPQRTLVSSSPSRSPRPSPPANIDTIPSDDTDQWDSIRDLQDVTSSKRYWSYSRRLAHRLMKYKWYYPPREDGIARPNLAEGWYYYEHFTLARQLIHDDHTIDSSADMRASRGNTVQKTQLYPYCSTDADTLADWGIGIALYFSTIRGMAFFLFVAFLFSIPNMVFFEGSRYGPPNHSTNSTFTMLGSAVCTVPKWVACQEGYCDITSEIFRDSKSTYGVDETTQTTFVQKSACDGELFTYGMLNYCAVWMLIILTALYGFYQSQRAIKFDEDKVTCSDYSILVRNPPKNATDPEEWRNFFTTFDEDEKGITCCTIILNNQDLLRKLILRRNLREELRTWLPDTNLDNDSSVQFDIETQLKEMKEKATTCSCIFQKLVKPLLNKIGMALGPQDLYERIQETTKEIKELQTKDYDVSHVIVTFETENSQRTCLQALTTSRLDIRKQNTEGKSAELFRGEVVLDINLPYEPSSFRYLDLDVTYVKSIIQQSITFCMTIGLLAIGGFMVTETRDSAGPVAAGILTSVLNIIIPLFVNIMLLFEQHEDESERQRSLYMKITIFRWINTAVMPRIVTPMSSYLGTGKNDLLKAIGGQFFSEIFFVPLLSILDIMGNVNKHYFAPRAKTQHQMYSCFQGTPYNIAERYTEMTRIVFLVYFYCVLDPFTFFLGVIVLVIRYYADKFCLLRIWKEAPLIGNKVAEFTRLYFSIAVIICAITSSYDWATFRFDKVCNGEKDAFEPGTYFITQYGPEEEKIPNKEIEVKDSSTFRVCTESSCCQDLSISSFPATSRIQTDELSWMSSEQELLSDIYGWTAFVIFLVFLAQTLGLSVFKLVRSMFRGEVEEQGQSQQIDFSSDTSKMTAYIPQIKLDNHSYPLIACDIDHIHQNLVGWKDPDKSYDEYNLIFDVPFKNMKRKRKIMESTKNLAKIMDHKDFKVDNVEMARPIFSTIKQWPPNYA